LKLVLGGAIIGLNLMSLVLQIGSPVTAIFLCIVGAVLIAGAINE